MKRLRLPHPAIGLLQMGSLPMWSDTIERSTAS
jgi:hypothetical protein